jgi:capsular polysaccharide transport system permease protein
MPPEAPDAWADVIQPAGMSRLEPIYAIPPPPVHQRRNPKRGLLRFVLLVLLPTLIAGGYFYLIASDRYMAEAHFVVRKPNAPNATASTSIAASVDGPKGFGGDDAFPVRDFLTSRDAMQLLIDKGDLRGALARADGDWFWQFPGPLTGDSNEKLYKLYKSLVTVDYDSSTGLTTLYVEAFRADDARRMALVLMTGAEALLNRMNERARTDAIKVADDEVAASRAYALAAQNQLTLFRDRASIIDPTQYSNTVLTTIGTMMLQLVEQKAELNVTEKSSPNSPQIPLYRSRVAAMQSQIDQVRGTLAGNDKSLAPQIAEYERLTLLRTFAERRFMSAMNLLESAKLDAQRQQTYLEQVVEPWAADEPRFPHRIPWIVGTFLVGSLIFWLFRPRAALD